MPPPPPQPELPGRTFAQKVKDFLALLRQLPGTVALVWQADRGAALGILALTLLSAIFPAGIAWVGKLIVDAVVAAAQSRADADVARVLELVLLELGLLAGSLLLSRGTELLRELVRFKLANLINARILDKALTLELRHFEDSQVYDKLQNARREASSRPLSLVLGALAIAQHALTLATFGVLLLRLSPWSMLVLVVAAIPAFIAEARLSAQRFRLYSWRAPEGRRLNYLEWILTRDSHVKEVKLFDLGGLILGRYRALFDKFYAEDRALALRRAAWGAGLGLLGLLAFYGFYVLVANRAARAEVTLGDLTLYLAVFRQGQAALLSILGAVGGMYEDALFMSNLFAYLGIPTGGEAARAAPPLAPPRGRSHGLVLDHLSFRYPNREEWALQDVSLELRPGEKLALVGENGAGKSTLAKLLLRLHEPTQGRILYGGVDLADMDVRELRSRVGGVFQDFVRYQFSAAENIGLGDPEHLEDRARIVQAAERAGAAQVVAALPHGYDTVLGGWFEKGHELSSGQWQKLAVARGFMRDAEILILDEPTASIDALAEAELFERLRALAADKTALIISHRFSTVRMADRIAVLHGGRLVELGTHDALMAQDGRYAHLFRLQARGYL